MSTTESQDLALSTEDPFSAEYDCVLVTDPELAREVREQRRESGAERWDEVWEGVYVMPLLPNDEHQHVVSKLTAVLEFVVGFPGLGLVRAGTNISDRLEGWTKNYRCPDLAVFLNDTKAVNRGTYWYGGPDLAIEVVSRGDRSHEKLAFYEKVNTGELLLIDRQPWTLELYRLQERKLAAAGRSTPAEEGWLEILAGRLRLRLTDGEHRPRIEVESADGARWTI